MDLHSSPWEGVLSSGVWGSSFLFPLWQSLELGYLFSLLYTGPLHALLPFSFHGDNISVPSAFDEEPHFCQYQWFQVLGLLGQS